MFTTTDAIILVGLLAVVLLVAIGTSYIRTVSQLWWYTASVIGVVALVAMLVYEHLGP